MNKFAFRKAHSRECRALDFQDLPFEEDVKATEKEILKTEWLRPDKNKQYIPDIAGN